MTKLVKIAKRFLGRKEEGATMVEYGLMVSLVAVACIAAVTAMSGGVQAVFNGIAGKLNG